MPTHTRTRTSQLFTPDDIERIEKRLELMGAVPNEDRSGWHIATLGGVRPLGECVAWMLEAVAPTPGADKGDNWRRGNVGSRCVVMSDLGVVCDTGSLLPGKSGESMGLAERICRAHNIAGQLMLIQPLVKWMATLDPFSDATV